MYVHSQHLNTAKIAIIDDEDDNVFVLERMLQQAGYKNTFSTTDSRKATTLCADCDADLILLDLHMPEPNGFQLLEQFAMLHGTENFVPILVLTADVSSAARLKTLGLGAKDFLTKPIDRIELLLRTRNLLEFRYLYRKMTEEQRHAKDAKDAQLAAQAQAMRSQGYELTRKLGVAGVSRFDRRGERAFRVSQMTVALARALRLPVAEIELMETAAVLHDIGVAALPDEVVNLRHSDPQSRERFKEHAQLGADLLGGSDIPLLQLASQIAGSHHERWDGKGYPLGLRAESIPLAARIVAVAEHFEAISRPDTASGKCDPEKVRAEILRQSGFRFDPSVVEALMTLPI